MRSGSVASTSASTFVEEERAQPAGGGGAIFTRPHSAIT
jgi:hypothetical protein